MAEKGTPPPTTRRHFMRTIGGTGIGGVVGAATVGGFEEAKIKLDHTTVLVLAWEADTIGRLASRVQSTLHGKDLTKAEELAKKWQERASNLDKMAQLVRGDPKEVRIGARIGLVSGSIAGATIGNLADGIKDVGATIDDAEDTQTTPAQIAALERRISRRQASVKVAQAIMGPAGGAFLGATAGYGLDKRKIIAQCEKNVANIKVVMEEYALARARYNDVSSDERKQELYTAEREALTLLDRLDMPVLSPDSGAVSGAILGAMAGVAVLPFLHRSREPER